MDDKSIVNSRSVFTISTISGLFGLYIVYALIMNSLIGVQTLEKQAVVSLPPPEPPPDSMELAENYLVRPESDNWFLNAFHRVRSGRSYLYYNDWIHRPYHNNDPDNAIEFTPFAMVVKNDSERRPITMESESARVRFSHPFSIEEPETGRPVEGALQGKVRITGPDGMKIVGRNFYFSEEAGSIYSDEMVEFAFGENRGRADGIQLAVMIDRKRVSDEDFAVSGIKLITMFGKVKLELSPENQSEVEHIEVQCEGGFTFDTKLNVGTFRDRVTVVAPRGFSGTGSELHDSLSCDILKLNFKTDPALVAEPSEIEEDDEEFQGLNKNLMLTDFEASSVSRRVTFASQQNEIDAEMDSFHYNQLTRVATLRDPVDPVVVSQRQSKLYSPTIVLQHDEGGELSSLVCDGAGELLIYDQVTRKPELQTRWERQLRVHPESNSNLYRIELDERAVVFQPEEQLGLSADHLKLWVMQNEKEEPRKTPKVDRNSWQGGNLRPQNLLAVGNVRMNHAAFQGSTERLEVWFQQTPREDSGRARVKQVSRQKDVTEKKTKPVGGERVQGPKPVNQDEPFHAWADLIQVLLYVADDENESYVGSVVTTGNVKVTQAKSDGGRPLEIVGDRVEVRNQDSGNQNQQVHVFGSPARISDREVALAGNQLNLNRGSNRAWVTGPGVMMQEVMTGLDGETLPQPELLKVWWNEKMDFDGRTARFFDGVRTQLGKNSIICQEMHLTLDNRVEFQNLAERRNTRGSGDPEIAHLECLYGVQIDSEEYLDGQLVEIRQGEFGKLVYDRQQDRTQIVGPGILHLWRLDSQPLQQRTSAPISDPGQVSTEKSPHWQYHEIDFNGNIEGYLNRETTYFSEGVEIIYGPVSAPGSKVDLHHLPDGGGWIRSENLEVERVTDTVSKEQWLRLKAIENVKLEGRNKEHFKARAYMVTYDQREDKYRLRAKGESYNTIWRQKRPGDKFSRIEAKIMDFRPSTHELNLEHTRSLEGIE